MDIYRTMKWKGKYLPLATNTDVNSNVVVVVVLVPVLKP